MIFLYGKMIKYKKKLSNNNNNNRKRKSQQTFCQQLLKV